MLQECVHDRSVTLLNVAGFVLVAPISRFFFFCQSWFGGGSGPICLGNFWGEWNFNCGGHSNVGVIKFNINVSFQE